jgi:UDP-N-acetylmuramate dehydrogenase
MLIHELERVLGKDNILIDEPLSRHTSFRIGGPAHRFLMPAGAEEVREAVRILKEAEEPFFIMGNGTNLLVSDEGYNGTVIALGKNMADIRTEGHTITADAGALLSKIAAEALKESLTGFEFAAGIPGSLGGACVMNAGAYGGEMKDVLASCEILTKEGDIRTVSGPELGLSYRHSALMERGDLVLSAVISLEEGRAEEIRARMEDLKKRRQDKQPLELPSAGSTFKRPEGYFAGKLIQDCGLKGLTVGGAQVSEKHAGFVINIGGATAADVRELIRQVQERVKDQFGVLMEPEIRMIGEFE